MLPRFPATFRACCLPHLRIIARCHFLNRKMRGSPLLPFVGAGGAFTDEAATRGPGVLGSNNRIANNARGESTPEYLMMPSTFDGVKGLRA